MEHSEQQGSDEIKISIHFLIPFPVTASRALRVPVMLQLIPGKFKGETLLAHRTRQQLIRGQRNSVVSFLVLSFKKKLGQGKLGLIKE